MDRNALTSCAVTLVVMLHYKMDEVEKKKILDHQTYHLLSLITALVENLDNYNEH